MDDVKRWRMDVEYDAKLDDAGYWVRHDDYTALRARLDAVENERDECMNDLEQALDQRDTADARAERAEAALATARRDALEEAATVTRPIEGIGHCQMPMAWRDAIRALIAQEGEE
jgi:hypothetical protein